MFLKKLFISIFTVLVLFTFSGCTEGTESLPEMSGIIFNALKAGSISKLNKAIPSEKSIEKYYASYYANKYPTPEERKQEAINKSQAMRLNLNLQLQKALEKAKEKGLDWSKAKMSDFKYNVENKKEGYQEAEGRVIVESNNQKYTFLYRAFNIENRWFLDENLKMQE